MIIKLLKIIFMKKMYSFLMMVALIIAISTSSCNNAKEGKESNTDSNNVTTTIKMDANSANVKKYSMKSGKVTSTAEVMGLTQNMITYFDDYGAKECIETSGEMMGRKQLNRTIMTKDFIYQLDILNKAGVKTKKSEAIFGADIDFSKVDEEMLQKQKMKRTGTENFLGRTCDKYTIDNEKIKGYFLVWNNMPLKTEGEAMKMKIKIEASKIEENVSIPAEVFEVPADFKITER